jgi:WD40 repeat protein
MASVSKKDFGPIMGKWFLPFVALCVLSLAICLVSRSNLPWSFGAKSEKDIEMPPLVTLFHHAGSLNTIAISPDGKLLATGDDEDGTVTIWEVHQRQKACSYLAHRNGVTALTFSHDGKTLASGGRDRAVRLWRVGTWQEITNLLKHREEISCVAFDRNDKMLASSSAANESCVFLWNLETQQGRQVYQGKPWPGRESPQDLYIPGVESVAFSPDGNALGLCCDRSAVVVDVTNGKEKSQWRAHESAIRSVAFDNTGKLLLTGSNEIFIWDWVDQKKLISLELGELPVLRFAVAPDKQLIAVGGMTGGRDPGAVFLFDLRTGRKLTDWRCHSRRLTRVAVAPDGNFLATASVDETVMVWDITKVK